MQNLLVSIIIPCKDEKDNIDDLVKDICNQKVSFDTEVIKVTSISPPGKARNTGARKAKGNVLVFVDCDIRLGKELFLQNLVNCLVQDKSVGAVCASLCVPPKSSKFQIRYAREIPLSKSPIVDKATDVFSASSACFAIYKDMFSKIGGFNEDITRGEDSVISYELRRAGHRVVLAPRTWCYHPQPGNIIELIVTNIRNGLGVSFADTFYPHLNLDIHPKGILYFSEKKTISERISRFVLAGIDAIPKRQVLLLLSKLFYALGYCYGVFKYRISRYDKEKGSNHK